MIYGEISKCKIVSFIIIFNKTSEAEPNWRIVHINYLQASVASIILFDLCSVRKIAATLSNDTSIPFLVLVVPKFKFIPKYGSAYAI